MRCDGESPRAARRSVPTRLVAALIVAISVGCTGTREDSSDQSTYTLIVGRDEWVMSPVQGSAAKFLVFLELATPNAEGELEGRLARSWTHSADYREWTVNLRTDVRWHDGVPVTAHDVKFTIDLVNHPDVMPRVFNTGFLVYESARVVDDSTVVIRYKDSSMWHAHWYPGYWPVFYPKHLLEHLDPAKIAEWEFWTHPVGNGPFRYVRHTPKTVMEFEANPDFYLGPPKIDRLFLRFGPESITELLAGNVDAININDKNALHRFQNDDRFVIYFEAWDDIGSVTSLIYNQRNPLFADARVRRAIAHGIDRPQLQRVLNMWEDLPLVDVPFTENQYWSRQLPEPLPYDPSLARELLEEVGWRDTDGDGVRERDGVEFRFEIITGQRRKRMAVYVQDQLRQIGLAAEITALEGRAAWDRAYVARDFPDAFLGIVWVPPDDPDLGINLVVGENSVLGFDHPGAQALAREAMQATTPRQLDSIYAALAPIIQEEQPFAALTFSIEAYVANARVKGLSSPFRANPMWYAGHLWIEDKP